MSFIKNFKSEFKKNIRRKVRKHVKKAVAGDKQTNTFQKALIKTITDAIVGKKK